jgi:hypothetical protein
VCHGDLAVVVKTMGGILRLSWAMFLLFLYLCLHVVVMCSWAGGMEDIYGLRRLVSSRSEW